MTESDFPDCEPHHRRITVTILDTVTGKTRKSSKWTPWFWAYGNGDCDCNRSLVFDPNLEEIECGEKRYYIVAVEGDESGYAIGEDYNHGYPPLPVTTVSAMPIQFRNDDPTETGEEPCRQ